MSHALIFNGVPLSPITHQNSLWIRSAELARALGYADESSVGRIYQRNADEFSADMTQLIEIPDSVNLTVPTRIFSLRGCHLVAMFSRTKVAKDFRKWVLNVLDSLTTAERRPLADELLLPPAPSSADADAAVARHIFAAIDAAECCAPQTGQPVSVPLLPPEPEAEGGRARVRHMEALPGGLLCLHLSVVCGAVPSALVLESVVVGACDIRTGDTLRFAADARFLGVDMSARPLSALPLVPAGEARHG
ncbi:BRO family protein [uncultured Desulfovibrio sp.]|uniref:BRO-N domain-containing protein n=1 Tax=uncultured Desulfovibrio sp. TaxID=167968 RepID=UPI00261B536E|nr:BRO family protein [uncultured Desulfovibrio sp.]